MPTLPTLSGLPGLAVLRAMGRDRSLLAGLAAMHTHLGNAFQITLPGFKPIVFVGPETNRHILVGGRDDFLWRTESDPVTDLLRHGLLVEDGESHDCLRRCRSVAPKVVVPSCKSTEINSHIPRKRRARQQLTPCSTGRVIARWPTRNRSSYEFTNRTPWGAPSASLAITPLP